MTGFGVSTRPQLCLIAILATASLLAAVLFAATKYYPGRLVAEAVVPKLHSSLPRGRTWAGSGPGDPVWRPSVRVIRAGDGAVVESLPALIVAVGAELPITTTKILLVHLALTFVATTLAMLLIKPGHVRRALWQSGAGHLAYMGLRVAAISAMFLAILPAAGQFAWLVWWKFDRFDVLGPFHSPATFAVRDGYPVALGGFGVGGIWAGVVLVHLASVAGLFMHCAGRDPLVRLRLSGLCANCGYPSTGSTGGCPECGNPESPAGTVPAFRVLPSRLARALLPWTVYVGWFVVLFVALMWPLVAAWPGRFMPDDWVHHMPC